MTRVLGRLFGGIASAVLVLLELAALALAPFRIGRLIRSVSLPRMREHRVRTTLTLIGAALGVSVLVSVVIVSRSVARGVSGTIDDLAGKAAAAPPFRRKGPARRLQCFAAVAAA